MLVSLPLRRIVPVIAAALLVVATAASSPPRAAAQNGTERWRPVLSTFIGGKSFDHVRDVATDTLGNVYVAGYAMSGFRTTPGVVQETYGGVQDGFVIKLDPDGKLLWSTYIGGSEADSVAGLAVGLLGEVYVGGETFSSDFPTTEGAYQEAIGHEIDPDCWEHCRSDAFITKLSPDGSELEFSTYFGGDHSEGAAWLALTGSGTIAFAGSTNSRDLPVTPGAFQPTYQSEGCEGSFCHQDAYVATLSGDGADLVAASYFGALDWESPNTFALDPAGNLVIAGLTTSAHLPTSEGAYQPEAGEKFDGFISALTPDATSLAYSTYLATGRDEMVNDVAFGPDGSVYAAGFTGSRGFPTTPDALQPGKAKHADGYVVRFAPGLTDITYSTYLGANDFDVVNQIEVSETNEVTAAGFTMSGDFPRTRGAIQTRNPGDGSLFFTRFRPGDGAPVYSTFFGGKGTDTLTAMRPDGDGGFLLGGVTGSRGYPLAGDPVVRRLRQQDGVVTHLRPGGMRRVRLTDRGFSARELVVAPGTTVRWAIRTTKGGHSVEDAGPLAAFRSGKRPRTSEYYFTFTLPGIHQVRDAKSGRRMKVTVAAP